MPTTVMVAQERTLVLDLRCDLVLLWTPTSFLTSTLALVLALAVAHVVCWDLVMR